MPKFSAVSLFRLSTCHDDLVTLFNEVIQTFDCTILEGYRTQAKQDAAYLAKNSKVKYPYGKHNQKPSHAVDVAPYPVNFNDTRRSYLFAGYVLGIAEMLKKEGKMRHSIRCGADWDGDTDLNDQVFNDLNHFEIIV